VKPDQIELLRRMVTDAAKVSATVLWLDPAGAWRRVRAVPLKPTDPDGTGFLEIVALLETGHLDLANCDPQDFRIAIRLFSEAA
jgi:hypothetical protein